MTSPRHATLKETCAAISDPRSHVSVRARCLSAFTTVWVSLESLTNIAKRDFRATRVAMSVSPEPASKSPSQRPSTARSSASAGRSRIDTASSYADEALALGRRMLGAAEESARAEIVHQFLFQARRAPTRTGSTRSPRVTPAWAHYRGIPHAATPKSTAATSPPTASTPPPPAASGAETGGTPSIASHGQAASSESPAH